MSKPEQELLNEKERRDRIDSPVLHGGSDNWQDNDDSKEESMNLILQLFARGGSADSPANKWLDEHPFVLGAIFLTIGIALAASGIYELRKGVAHDKRGREVHGGGATALSILRIVGGVGACGFAIYKMIAG
jgi:hypothetical protein